ncbi:PAS domain-containing protein [Sinorhizobium psoraleae]|uniref:PAS domain-containing protein n=1 Tax=Sinorhizobium psoraleae TaxID=520838 RepID=A0ABT4KE22_9HYPH|nr:PAS domain-containing protein [Sinorhizobium psoraleae]MCZ4090205.1 PAS domain-containing protein [Sinorhizobium psoraleae]
MATDHSPEQLEQVLRMADLVEALESRQFKRFLDKVPIAIAVSKIGDRERIVYVNPEFERLRGWPRQTSWVGIGVYLRRSLRPIRRCLCSAWRFALRPTLSEQ